MRWRATLLLGLLAVLPASAEDWTTADGKTYKNVTIVEQTDGGVRITYTGGVGIIPDYELPLDVQKRLGIDFDSLQAKKKAAQQAADEAARNAAAAAAAADAAAAAVAKTNPQAAANSATQPAGTNPTTTAPGMQPGSTAPGAPAPANASAATASPSAPGSPAAATNAPGASTPGGAAAASTANPKAPGTPGAVAPSDLNNPYPGSTYTYDESVDTSYLVSPTVSVALVPPDATKPPIAGQGALALRIESDGLKPTAPDRVEATFHGVGAPPATGVDHHIKFLVDGNYVPAEEIPPVDGDTTGNISFYFSPAQAKSIFTGHNVNFSVAKSNYRVDEDGIAVFHKYLGTIDHLPPEPVSFSRTIHKFIDRLPPLSAIISTICEYVIVGGAGLIVVVALMMFAIGTRAIIKW